MNLSAHLVRVHILVLSLPVLYGDSAIDSTEGGEGRRRFGAGGVQNTRYASKGLLGLQGAGRKLKIPAETLQKLVFCALVLDCTIQIARNAGDLNAKATCGGLASA